MRSPDEGRKLTKDPRFVIMDCRYQANDWEVGAHTGIDYWSRAGDLVAKRLSGEIDALQYRIEVDESLALK
ncbi:hypothetical protein B0H14DRAFT_3457307 [Mycena olivaceomarginata]|nr:hypothetical protein B0H14DRAFT_3457307 [Mycena olivaceomarginata]